MQEIRVPDTPLSRNQAWKHDFKHGYNSNPLNLFSTLITLLMCIYYKWSIGFSVKSKLTLFPKLVNLQNTHQNEFLPFQLQHLAQRGGCVTYLPLATTFSWPTSWYFSSIALGLSTKNYVSIFFVLECSSSFHQHPLLVFESFNFLLWTITLDQK
jgi:hypothetical protein